MVSSLRRAHLVPAICQAPCRGLGILRWTRDTQYLSSQSWQCGKDGQRYLCWENIEPSRVSDLFVWWRFCYFPPRKVRPVSSKWNYSEAVLSFVRGCSKRKCFLITEEGNFWNHKVIPGCSRPDAHTGWEAGLGDLWWHPTSCPWDGQMPQQDCSIINRWERKGYVTIDPLACQVRLCLYMEPVLDDAYISPLLLCCQARVNVDFPYCHCQFTLQSWGLGWKGC